MAVTGRQRSNLFSEVLPEDNKPPVKGTARYCRLVGVAAWLLLLVGGVLPGWQWASPAHAATDPSLVGLWHMDGDWTDASGNGNNGTAYNDVTFSANARVGSHAGSFDGVNDYVQVKSSAIIANSAQSTIVAWVNPASFAAAPSIYTENSSAGAVFNLGIDTAGKATFGIWRNNVWMRVTSGAALPLNTWSHVVATLDATGMKVYVNGMLSATCPIDQIMIPTI